MSPDPRSETRPNLSDAVRNRQPAIPTPQTPPRRSRLFFALLVIVLVAVAIVIWASLRR